MERVKKKVKKRAGKRIHGAVTVHAEEKAKEIREKYGPDIDYPVLLQILEDRKSIRNPVEIRFSSTAIGPGLFASTEAVSEDPAEGYLITVHENFRERQDVLPALILYQAVIVNYGDLATAIDAEVFGAGVLGMERDDYYDLIVELTDSVWGSDTG
jgi:hypothetical protein